MCFNWKVLAGLGAVGVGIYLVNPGLVLSALPLLLLAACPLSMLFMGKSMMGGMQQGAAPGPAVAGGARYTCPMHPAVQQDQPGRCPTCAMSLVPAAAPQRTAVVAPAEGGAGVSRDTQLALLRAQLQALDEQQAALAAQFRQLQQAEAAAPPPSPVVEEAEQIAAARAAASRS